MVGHPLTLQQLPPPPLPAPVPAVGTGLAPARHPRVPAPPCPWSPGRQRREPAGQPRGGHIAKAGQGLLGPRVLGTMNCVPAFWQREYLWLCPTQLHATVSNIFDFVNVSEGSKTPDVCSYEASKILASFPQSRCRCSPSLFRPPHSLFSPLAST